jgi:transposase
MPPVVPRGVATLSRWWRSTVARGSGATCGDEIDDIHRFPTVQQFSSYCRLVKGTVASAGKIKGLRGAKLGNPYLRWAIGEAAMLGRRHDARIAAWHERLAQKKGSFKANAIAANQLGRTLYFMLQNGTVFDVAQLIGNG